MSPHELTELHLKTICAGWKLRHGRSRRYMETAYLKSLVRSIERLTGRSDLLPAIPKANRSLARTTTATPDEVKTLIAAAQPWLRTIILAAAHAGLRRSDAMRLAPAHYDAEKKLITIEQRKTARKVSIPVSDELAAHLNRIEPEHPLQPYCDAFRGKPVKHHTIAQQWQALKKKTGVNRELWIHDLRRTAAVTLYQLTKDLQAVATFLGHSSIMSTCSYLEQREPEKLKPYLDQMWKPKTEVIQ